MTVRGPRAAGTARFHDVQDESQFGVNFSEEVRGHIARRELGNDSNRSSERNCGFMNQPAADAPMKLVSHVFSRRGQVPISLVRI